MKNYFITLFYALFLLLFSSATCASEEKTSYTKVIVINNTLEIFKSITEIEVAHAHEKKGKHYHDQKDTSEILVVSKEAFEQNYVKKEIKEQSFSPSSLDEKIVLTRINRTNKSPSGTMYDEFVEIILFPKAPPIHLKQKISNKTLEYAIAVPETGLHSTWFQDYGPHYFTVIRNDGLEYVIHFQAVKTYGYDNIEYTIDLQSGKKPAQ